jgi:hypothetical protein
MYCDIAIVGGGMGGVIAAAWAKINRPDSEVVLIEPGQPGAGFNSGGLRYLRWNPRLGALLDSLGHLWAKVPVYGGILIPDGTSWRVADYPGGMSDIAVEAHQRAHWDKTRPGRGGFSRRVMNEGGRESFKIEAGPGLVEAMLEGVTVIKATVIGVDVNWRSTYIRTSPRATIEAATTIWTPPAPALMRLCGLPYEQREFRHANLNVIHGLHEPDNPIASRDYVYTPYLASRIHRISKAALPGVVQLEWNGDDGLTPEIIEDCVVQLGIQPTLASFKEMPGHLAPMGVKARHALSSLPPHFRMLGRYAEWDSRATVDQSTDKMEAWYAH